MDENSQATDNLWEAISTQRAIRWIKPDPVPDELIWKLIEAATKAPSGSNLQPWRFIVITDATTKRTIADAVRARRIGAGAAVPPATEPRTDAERSQARMMRGASHMSEHLDEVPVLIVPCLYQVRSPAKDGLLSGSSIYQAVQNLLLAARGLGLGALMATWQMAVPDFATLLGIPEDAIPVALIPVGWPDANYGPTRRKPAEEVTFWDRWGESKERPA